MMNKKGQVLVVFVLILPLILILLGLVIDIGNTLIIKKKTENSLQEAIQYVFKNNDEINIDLLEKNIKENIKDYKNLRIDYNENIIKVDLEVMYKSIFTSIFGIGSNTAEINLKYNVQNKTFIREEGN